MNEGIKIFDPDSKEYKRLQVVANIMTMLSNDDNISYVVKTTYFDYGQDWKWTTILRRKNNELFSMSDSQILNPKQQREILYGTQEEFQKVIYEKLNIQNIDTTTTTEQIAAVIRCLEDNGIDPDETDVVTEALYYVMKNENIEKQLGVIEERKEVIDGEMAAIFSNP